MKNNILAVVLAVIHLLVLIAIDRHIIGNNGETVLHTLAFILLYFAIRANLILDDLKSKLIGD